MKLLRNPIVTGILALLAVVVVLYQVLGANLFRGRSTASKSSVTAAKPAASTPASKRAPAATPPSKGRKTTSSNAGITQTNLATALLPEQAVDASVVERGFQTWVAAPLRDPFRLLQPVVNNPGLQTTETNSPVSTWTLKAIWHQTDSRLAVIDGRVYRVGDVIEGYELLRIEKDEVWFQGPWHNERLGFPEPGKGAPPGKAKKSKAKTTPKKT